MVFNVNLNIHADNEHNAKVKVVVIKNLLSKLSDSQFVDTLYPKIQKNEDFFIEISNSPLLKMFK